jgi:hypothetical protein
MLTIMRTLSFAPSMKSAHKKEEQLQINRFEQNNVENLPVSSSSLSSVDELLPSLSESVSCSCTCDNNKEVKPVNLEKDQPQSKYKTH